MLKAARRARRSRSAQSTPPRLRLQIFRRRPLAQPELARDTILLEAMVQRVLTEQGASWRRVFDTPCFTCWASFWQALSPNHSCRAAVKRIAAWLRPLRSVMNHGIVS
jgi:hypothetical protein